MKMLKSIGALLAAAMLLTGCGGGANTLTTPPSGGGGGGGTATAATLAVTTNAASILADGTTTATITALALDSNNVSVANVAVTYRASSGGLVVGSTKTDASGVILATLSAGGDPTLRTITVTATAGSLTATTTVQVISTASSSPVAAITAQTSNPTILSDGSQSATITAFVRDASNTLLPNVPVTFTASSGGISSTNPTTNASGVATANLSTAGDPTLRTITVRATVNALSATVPVQVVSGAGSVTVQMGSGIGVAFTAGTIALSSATLSVGGSTSLQVVLQQSDGTLYAQPVTVAFNSPCVAQNTASVTPAVATTTGVATATYSASGCSGSDTITASATIGGRQLSATGTVNVQQSAIGSISFVSASPAMIALKGIGSTSLTEQSVVTFQVLDQSGKPRAAAVVDFSLNTSVGGVTLLNATATSDATGNVSTTVQSGTVATPVRVTASVQIPNSTSTISTQSSQLTVSTGIPQQNGFSLAVTCQNVEAWNLVGVRVPVTAYLVDRFNNAVPDGTAVSFYTEGGTIKSSCTTTSAAGAASCSVNWTSTSNRAPADLTLPVCGSGSPVAGSCDRAGRSSLMAIAIGEESFVDRNGNGSFDVGDTFTDQAERFLDANENGTYQANEFFYDFNSNNARDAADGLFNGVLCTDVARCAADKESTAIDAHNVIILSDGTPGNLSPAAGATLGTLSKAAGGALYVFTVADLNFNPMPAGTTIVATTPTTGLTIAAPTSYTVPCMTEPGSYAFFVQSSGSVVTSSGQLTLTITSPGGIVTTAFYSFPIGT
ncbi:MAG: Ig-like domain-containing protein [Pseudomonadota bacterium]